MRRSCSRLFAISLSIALLFVCLPSFAQKVTGTITGVVTDPTGAIVPGATVAAKNPATGTVRTAKTDTNGVYTFPQVEVGDYTVTVTKEGFKTFTQKDVGLHVATTTTANFQLQVGSTSEQVEVEASAVQVNTENGTVGNVMEGEQVRELPMNGRNFVQLTTLIPGASVSENFDNKNKGLLAGVDISFSGASSSANQWLVDGANNNDEGSQRTILIYPSIDGIEEFKILRNSYGPEFGGAGGAQINVVTKGGGNNFHGDAYYFGRNAYLNAKNYFLGQGLNGQACTPSNPNYLSCKKQKLQRNDFGYTFGGPIKKDKIFFFWSEEWNRERRGVVRQDQVLTAQERQGNFSDLSGCPAGSRVMPINPATGAPFAGNVIPPNLLSAGGGSLIAMQPLPTITDPCKNPNWVAQVNVPLNWREENIRGDWNITKANSLMIRYAQDTWVNPTEAYEEGGLWGSQYWPAVNDSWSQPGKQAVAKLTSTLGTTAVNDFQFSWSANRIVISQGGTNPGLEKAVLQNVPAVFPPSGKLHGGQGEIPVCWCSSFFGTMAPWHNRQDLFTWKDDFSKVIGNHTFKVGGLYDRNAKDEEAGSGAESGQFWGVGGYQANLAGNPGGSNVNWAGSTGNFDADLLLKGTLWGGAESARNTWSQIRWRDYEFYFGDTWKMTRTFTFDYGFRWSFIRPEWMADNLWSSFSPSAYNPALGSDACNGILLPQGAPNMCQTLGFKGGTYANNRTFVPNNNHLIAPRLGIAWDVFGDQKFVLRAGAGQFFARDPLGLAIVDNQGNPPFGISAPFYHALDGPLVAGVNLFDGGGGSNIAAGGVPSTGFDQNTNLSNSWQWNITTESQLWKDAKLEIGWVGLRGIHLQSTQDANEIAPQNRLAYIMRGLNNSGDNRADLYPFGKLTTGNISMFGHRGDSIYHSLQAMFTTKIHHNSIFQLSYTWSKNIADVPLGYNNGPGAYIDTYNTRASRGLANFDRRNVFNASFVYNLPTFDGANGFVKSVLGGWETSTIVQLASGPALTATIDGTYTTIYYNGTKNGFNPWGMGTTNGFTALPNVTNSPCSLSRNSNSIGPLQFLNPEHFTLNGAVIGTEANSGIGQCPGPGLQDLDFALDKNFVLPIGGNGGRFFPEHPKLQFRLETFNLLNHPMFRFNGSNLAVSFQCADPVKLINCPTLVGNTISGGVVNYAVDNFGKLPLASNIGNREIQYALKFIF